MVDRDRYLKVVGLGGPLRENSTSLGALRRALAAAGDAGDITDHNYARRLDKLGGLVVRLAEKVGAVA